MGRIPACLDHRATHRAVCFSTFSIGAWGGVVAVVEFGTGAKQDRGGGVPDPLGMAAATPGRLAGFGQPTSNRSGTGRAASMRQSRLPVRGCRLDCWHGQVVGLGIDAATTRTAKNEAMNGQRDEDCPNLVAATLPAPFLPFATSPASRPLTYWDTIGYVARRPSPPHMGVAKIYSKAPLSERRCHVTSYVESSHATGDVGVDPEFTSPRNAPASNA